MAERTYEFTAIEAIACDSCRNLSAGDTVDITLNQVLIPALPASIRGIVQLVDDLTYTIQYDDDDLLGAAVSLDDTIVLDVLCVPCCVLAQEYSDGRDDVQDVRTTSLEDSLAALGVVPTDGDNQFVVHSDSTTGVSVESIRHDKVTIAKSGGSETIILNPEELATPLAILDLTGLSYRIEMFVSGIAVETPTDNRDSAAEFLLVGQFNAGASYKTNQLMEKDAVTIVGVKVGNNFHITLTNPSSGDIEMFVTSKFRVLS